MPLRAFYGPRRLRGAFVRYYKRQPNGSQVVVYWWSWGRIKSLANFMADGKTFASLGFIQGTHYNVYLGDGSSPAFDPIMLQWEPQWHLLQHPTDVAQLVVIYPRTSTWNHDLTNLNVDRVECDGEGLYYRDPVQDATLATKFYGTNPVLQALDIDCDTRFGGGFSVSIQDWNGTIIEARNDADLDLGGGRLRYAPCSIELDATMDYEPMMEMVRGHCALNYNYNSGKKVWWIDKSRPATGITFTDDGPEANIVTCSPLAVKGSAEVPTLVVLWYTNSDAGYKRDFVQSKHPLLDSGGVAKVEWIFEFKGVLKHDVAQRLADLHRKRAEVDKGSKIRTLSEGIRVLPGSRVTITSAKQLNWANVDVLVTDCEPVPDSNLQWDLTVELWSDDVHDDTAATTTSYAPPAQPSPYDIPVPPPTSPLDAAALTFGDGLTVQPGGVNVTWKRPTWPRAVRYRLTTQVAGGPEVIKYPELIDVGPVFVEVGTVPVTIRIFAIGALSLVLSVALAGTTDPVDVYPAPEPVGEVFAEGFLGSDGWWWDDPPIRVPRTYGGASWSSSNMAAFTAANVMDGNEVTTAFRFGDRSVERIVTVDRGATADDVREFEWVLATAIADTADPLSPAYFQFEWADSLAGPWDNVSDPGGSTNTEIKASDVGYQRYVTSVPESLSTKRCFRWRQTVDILYPDLGFMQNVAEVRAYGFSGTYTGATEYLITRLIEYTSESPKFEQRRIKKPTEASPLTRAEIESRITGQSGAVNYHRTFFVQSVSPTGQVSAPRLYEVSIFATGGPAIDAGEVDLTLAPGTHNDVNPGATSKVLTVIPSPDGVVVITGLQFGVASRHLTVRNGGTGSSTVLLLAEDAGSAAASRFSSTYVIPAGESIQLWYDFDSSGANRWRVIGLGADGIIQLRRPSGAHTANTIELSKDGQIAKAYIQASSVAGGTNGQMNLSLFVNSRKAEGVNEWPVDNPALPSWGIEFGSEQDAFVIERSPAGTDPAWYDSMVELTNVGDMAVKGNLILPMADKASGDGYLRVSTKHWLFNDGTAVLNSDGDERTVSIGGNPVIGARCEIFSPGPGYSLHLIDTTPMAGGVGPALTFCAKKNAAGHYALLAQILGYKENATEGDEAGGLWLSTRPSGGSLTPRVYINSSGDVGVGTNGQTARLHVKGASVLGADTALLVTDSAGATLFRVANDGAITGLNVTEAAQDAVGAMAASSATIDVTYTDVTPEMKWDVKDDAITFAKMQNVAAGLIGNDAGTADPKVITVGNGVEFSGGGVRRSALTGDVTAAAGSNSTTIANAAVTYAKMQDVAATSLVGRASNSAGAPAAISATADNQIIQRTGGALGWTASPTLTNVYTTEEAGVGTTTPKTNAAGYTYASGRHVNITSTAAAAVLSLNGTDTAIDQIDSNYPANERWFQQLWSSGTMHFRILTDAGTLQRTMFTVTGANGNVAFGGAMRERGRTHDVGGFEDFTPTRTAATGTWTGGTVITARRTRVGKKTTVAISITGSTLSAATAYIAIQMPDGATSPYQVGGGDITGSNAGTPFNGSWIANPAANQMYLYVGPGQTGTWAAGNVDIRFTIEYETN